MKNTWSDIHDALQLEIEDGVLEPGARLPTEPELAALYDAGRHSVRRAIMELAKRGKVSIEQGRGTFVLPTPKIEYVIGRRTRLRRNLSAKGIEVSGEALGSETLPATDKVAESLGLAVGAPVIATRRLTRADGVPVSFGALHHDPARFADFPERRASLGSVTATYATYGIEDYLRGSTAVHSRPCTPDEARLLRQHKDLPVMVVRAIDILPDGTPIAFSEVIWSAARVRFTFATEPDE